MLIDFSIIILPLFLITAAAQPPSPSPSPSIHDLLPKYGLPRGLIPNAVASFSFSQNGHFQLKLNSSSPCYVDFEYLTFFDSNISGVLKYGGIDELKGVQVRKLLIWFDVVSIKVDLPPSDFIYFEFAWVTKKFRMDQFSTVRDCNDKKDLVLLNQVIEPLESDLVI